jgi:M6 family metalloprotease-like protein
MKHGRSIGLVLAALVLSPGLMAAQQQISPRWEIPGFDFSPNGVWRARARRIAKARTEMLWRRDFPGLNAAMAAATASTGAPAVTGTLLVPAILVRYNDTNLGTLRDTAQYSAVLFGAVPPAGRHYTVRTFYEELSRGLFSMQGRVLGWAALANNEVSYTGQPGTCSGNPFGTSNCNGIFSTTAITTMQAGMAEALGKLDQLGVDWGQFDNDGLDGIPNSADDDGYVDMAIFVHPALDGACGGGTNNHIWSHRYQLVNPYVTKTPAHNGGFIRVRDYTFQSGVGGSTACDTTQIMPVGTAAHESGHGLDLPDLYDLSFATEGIGEWGIMGSGNYTSPLSPSRMEPWSLGELGWVNLVPLTTSGVHTLGPAPESDSAFLIRPTGANPRGEYFLVENRQAVGADSALIRIHCVRSGNPPGCGGGLLVWHVDSSIAVNSGFRHGNRMNSSLVHGLVLEEADGLRNLWNSDNRGDAGDPYPGTSGNSAFSFGTNPAATKNSDTTFVGFAIDSIRQLVPNGEMSFRLRFGGLTLVEASDTTAQVKVDGLSFNVFRNLLEDGSSHTIAVTDSQLSPSGRTRFSFQSWSDGQPISHTITGAFAGATYTATLGLAHRLDVTVGANGTVAFSPAADSSGTFIDQGTPVTLTATPTSPFVFAGWTGDTTAVAPILVLPMGRPYALSPHFDPQLLITSATPRPAGRMGASYADTLRATGGGSSQSWQIVTGNLPPGLALLVPGQITGFPSQTGLFTFTARVTSGAQFQQQTYSITVTAPTLAKAAVLSELLAGTGTLSSEDLQYLDLLGNRSCPLGGATPTCFDVGDFLAWVQATGATPAAPIAAAKGVRP